jgi:L-ascorbate peroxidase
MIRTALEQYRVHADRESTKYTENGPGTKGGVSWTPEWLHFDNSYFVEVKEKRDKDLIVLETDDILFNDKGFAPPANAYAESQDKFFDDYAAAHKKLSELGVVWEEGAPVKLD